MKTYKIEQYELWIQTYTVQANSEAEAIATLFHGEAQADDNALEYVEIAEDYGMNTDDLDKKTIAELSNLGFPCKEILNGIRSIEECN